MEGIGSVNISGNENWYQAKEKLKNAKINLQNISPSEMEVIRPTVDTYPITKDTTLVKEVGFDGLLQSMVDKVDEKQKASTDAVRKIMTGESDNLHQAMIAQQESGVAFNLLLETRNKLVEGYKELFRMQI